MLINNFNDILIIDLKSKSEEQYQDTFLYKMNQRVKLTKCGYDLHKSNNKITEQSSKGKVKNHYMQLTKKNYNWNLKWQKHLMFNYNDKERYDPWFDKAIDCKWIFIEHVGL